MEAVQSLPTVRCARAVSYWLKATAVQYIRATNAPTCAAFLPLLQANREHISLPEPSTHSFGPLTRQKADIFLAKAGSYSGTLPPVLFFFYGGGLVAGGRKVPHGDGLAYTNVGRYFSDCGFTAVIGDYRLVPMHVVAGGSAPEGVGQSGEPARFPSGAEDVYLCIKWALQYLEGKADTSIAFAMGNSAGGLHLATMLYHSEYYLSDDKPGMDAIRRSLRRVVFLGTPTGFGSILAERRSVFEYYYGSIEAAHRLDPTSMLGALADDQIRCLPPTLDLVSQNDPDEILVANKSFAKLATDRGAAYETQFTATTPQGFVHNHISPPWALCSGQGEEWGEQVIRWLRSSFGRQATFSA